MKRFVILPVLFFIAGTALSQSLNDKWDHMLDKAETFQHYKVIKRVELSDVWKSVQDTVGQLKTELIKERAQIKQQQEQIAALQKEVAELTGVIEKTKIDRDSMSFLGMSVDKYNYANTLWFIIFGILAGAGILFYLYRNSNVVTVQKINEYDQLSKSFEEYKQSKIEMERKLKRELQTYMNKIEELKKM